MPPFATPKTKGKSNRVYRKRSKADRALAIARQNKKKLNMAIELKYKNNNLSHTVTTTTGFTLLNGILTGDTNSTRDGVKLTMSVLQLHYYTTIHASASNSMVRVLVVYDKQPNGAIFADSDLLPNSNFNDFYEIRNSKRFKVLFDKTHKLMSISNTAATQRVYKKINLPVLYGGTGATITSINSGSLYFMCISNEATNGAALAGYARIRYLDN